MKEFKRLGVHVLLLLLAAVAAFVNAQPDEGAVEPLKPGEVDVWGGSHDDVTRVIFEGKTKVVSLERQKDQRGNWYLGKVEPSEKQAEEPEKKPDAGPHSRPPKKVEPATFVSIKVGEKIAKAVAPLRAKRAIGEIAPDREKVFGLERPKGTLTVEIGDKKHVLIIGGPTPGSGSRYVRHAETKLVYVVDAEAFRDIEGGASRLSERSTHEWKFSEVEKATVLAGDKRRDLVRSGTEGRRFWADESSQDVNDETSNNWLRKVQNLRPVKYLEKLPEGAEKIVRVEYATKGDKLGWMDLYRFRGKDDKDEFLLSSEHLRLFGTVAKTLAEQVRDDMPSLFPAEE
jgi:hypothetical protein